MYKIIFDAVVKTKSIQYDSDKANSDYITTINSKDIMGYTFANMLIQIPFELIRKVANENTTTIRAVSFLYNNVENLFPSGFRDNENM